MSYIYLLATQDDSSVISCYKRGDKIKADIGMSSSIPLSATNCSNCTTFLLKHLDHFVEDVGLGEAVMKPPLEAPDPAPSNSISGKPVATENRVQYGLDCNACRMPIKGIRYKCLECHAYDLCVACQSKGSADHNPSHMILCIPAKNEAVIHDGYRCDVCNASPIMGIRYKCLDCDSYDLCEACKEGPCGVHDTSHKMLCILGPSSETALKQQDKPAILLTCGTKETINDLLTHLAFKFKRTPVYLNAIFS